MNKYLQWNRKSISRFFLFLLVITLIAILVQLSSGIGQLASNTFVSPQSVKSELAVSELPTVTEVPPTMTGEALPFYMDLTPEFPEITFIAPATGVPLAPIPTLTPLPTVDPNNHSPYASQNLVLHELPTPQSKLLQENGNRSFVDGSWSPDGQFFAASVSTKDLAPNIWLDPKIVIFDASGQVVKDLAVGNEPVWSPSGAFIAYQEWNDEIKLGHLRIVDVASGRVTDVTETTDKNGHPFYITWISDTEILFFKGEFDFSTSILLKAELLVFDYTSGQSHLLLDEKAYQSLVEGQIDDALSRVYALPKVGLIAIASGSVTAIFQRTNGELKLVRRLEGVWAGKPVLSPDGSMVAYFSSGTRNLIIAPIFEDALPRVEVSVGGTETVLTWSPDSASVLYTEHRKLDADGLNIINRDGSGLRLLLLRPQDSDIARANWNANGTITIIKSGGTVSNFAVDNKR